MPRRQMQRRLHVFETRIPARCSPRIAARHSRQCRQVYVRIAHLDAGAAIRAVRDEHHLVGALRIEQAIRCQHVETPALLHRAGDAIRGDEVVVIEREPQIALERQAMCVGAAQTAAALRNRHGRAALQAKRRYAAPVVRYARLDRIDRRRAFQRRDAQTVVTAVAPDLLLGPDALAFRNRDRASRGRRARHDRQLVLAGAHLHAQPSIRLEPHRQLAAARRRHEPFGQYARQQFLARIAGNLELHACRESQRNAVFEQPIDLHLQRTRHGHRANGAEPQPSRTHLHRRDRAPIDTQVDQRGRRGSCSDSGRRAQVNLPLMVCSPATRRTCGAPLRSTAGAGVPSTRTSSGQCSLSPGNATQLSA